MMGIFPSKSQWKSWTLPSKAGYISLLFAVIGILIAITGFVSSILSHKDVILDRLQEFIAALVEAGESNDPSACLRFYQFPIKQYFSETNVDSIQAFRDREELITKWPSRHYSLIDKPVLISQTDDNSGTLYTLVATFSFERQSGTEVQKGERKVKYQIIQASDHVFRIVSIFEFGIEKDSIR